jgi:hypothetical protein
MKRTWFAVIGALGLVVALGGPASAASSSASCQGLAASSLAGEAGAFADERRDAMAEAADQGITVGQLTSEFARSHAGTLDACFG